MTAGRSEPDTPGGEAARRNEHLASFPQLNPNPVVEIDLRGEVLFRNAAAAAALRELGREDDARLFAPADLPEMIAALGRGEETLNLYREVDVGGRSFAENIYASLALGSVRIYARDRTALREAERERELLLERLERAHAELERQVADRTADLARTVARLEAEVAERIATERSLRHREERYRSLVQATAQIVWTTDAAGRVVEDLPEGRAFTGQTASEILGSGWSAMVHPEDRGRATAVWERAVATRSLYETEYRLRRHDGVYRVMAVRGVPVLGEDGQIREWVGTCTDVTERRQLEERLEADRRQRALTGELLELFVRTSSRGEYLDAVATVLRAWSGCSRVDISAGAGADEAPHDPGEAGAGSGAVIPIRVGEQTLGTLRISDTRAGLLPPAATELLESLAPLIGEAIRRFDAEAELARHRDHLEEIVRQRTEELQHAAADLARSNGDLEGFASVVSHDLQEPLRAIAGYTSLLQRHCAGRLDAQADDYIRGAVDGAARMQQMVSDLLAYSRVGTQERVRRPASTAAALERALANLHGSLEEAGAVVTSDALPTVRADESQLAQLFQNLVGNAVKFRGNAPPLIHVGAERQKGGWLFSVRDNGIGLDPRHGEEIFEVFRRLHGRARYPGTGIGLAICKRIVERHGGRIRVESRPGEGATFLFTLPEGGEVSACR
jgi:PAS domain S-box-containing protein